VWGGTEPVTMDSLFDPDGMGWRLDRRLFETRLRAAAVEAGATLLAPVPVAHAGQDGKGVWRLQTGDVEVSARLLIDATGRAARLLRPWAGAPAVDDRLLCTWLHAPLREEAASVTYSQSVEDGWWYSAPLPGGRRLIAFHTDADLARGVAAVDLAGRALATPGLAALIADADLGEASPARSCAAYGARLASAAGPGWLAVGDAAMCFDPLSSQGLFHALYTGLKGGEAAAALLAGDVDAGTRFAAALEPVWDGYLFHRAIYYGMERRWPDAPFWQRRHLQGPGLDAVPASQGTGFARPGRG
jgi:flavin-dependent dehydrogenase